MKKRLYAIVLALLLCMFFAASSFAESTLPRFVDDAELLSGDDKEDLQTMLNEISQRQQVDVVIVTTPSLGGLSAMEYGDDFYDYNGYGFGAEKDGIILAIGMEERDWYIGSAGFGMTVITDGAREYISEAFLSDLSAGEYHAAFTTFAKLCDEFITQAKTGEPYDHGNLPEEPFGIVDVVISLVAGFVLAFFTTAMMKGKLKTVGRQRAANNYIKSGSLEMTEMTDLFLYAHVDRIEKPKEESKKTPPKSGGSGTHVSSSGTTHRGGGGKF